MKTRDNNGNEVINTCRHAGRYTLNSRFGGLPHVTWRDIFNGFTSPATRVHRYRDLHTRLLQESLSKRESQPRRPRSCTGE